MPVSSWHFVQAPYMARAPRLTDRATKTWLCGLSFPPQTSLEADQDQEAGGGDQRRRRLGDCRGLELVPAEELGGAGVADASPTTRRIGRQRAGAEEEGGQLGGG